MSGFWFSSSQNTAPRTHACRQMPHPVHFSDFSSTPPPFLRSNASSGQARAHGGSSQALHTTSKNPCCMPPADFMPMHDLPRPASWWILVQANMQHWQPTHFSGSITASLILTPSLPEIESAFPPTGIRRHQCRRCPSIP